MKHLPALPIDIAQRGDVPTHGLELIPHKPAMAMDQYPSIQFPGTLGPEWPSIHPSFSDV